MPSPKESGIEKIILLPVDVSKSTENLSEGASKKSLERGREVLEQTIEEFMADNPNIVSVSKEKQESLLEGYNKDRLQQAKEIGQKLQADAVLITEISDYRQRVGGDYSVEYPAAITFKYRLLNSRSGSTLCAGSYSGSQMPWTENLLSFGKAISRGGKWITAKDLTKEAVTEKFQDCQYFTKK